MRLSIASGLVTILIGAASAPHGADAKGAFAEDRHAAREACVADIKSFCSDITPGRGHVMLCIRSHEDKVSKPCHDAFDKLHADREKAS